MKNPETVHADDSRLNKAVDQALEAFWERIASSYPEAKTGDLDPISTELFVIAAKKTVRMWVGYNT